MSELKIVHNSWELNKLFRISRSSKSTAETIEVQISKNGKTGSGEGIPYSHYNETIDSVSLQIEDLRIGIENDEINLNNLNKFMGTYNEEKKKEIINKQFFLFIYNPRI